MPIWIVECSVCRKPFEREAPVMPVAPFVEIHPHAMKGTEGVPCMGAGIPGIGIGLKENYQEPLD